MFTFADKVLDVREIVSDLKVEALTVTFPPVDLSLIETVPFIVSKLVATNLVTL